jgi:hypothetical protein
MRELTIIETSDLTATERALLVSDVHDIVHDERRTWDDAQRILLSRIGGNANLGSYVACLVAGHNLRNRKAAPNA